IDSQSRPPSIRLRRSCACRADRLRERKILARPGQAACSKPPSRPRPRPPAESPTRVRPPQSSRTALRPPSPSSQRSSAAPAPWQAPVRPGPDRSASQRLISRRSPPRDRPLPALRRCMFRPALRVAIRAPLSTSPACVADSRFLATRHSSLATSPLKSPSLPRPCRPRRPVGARHLGELVFDLRPNFHRINPCRLTAGAGDVKLVPELLQLLEKHRGYLQTTLLVHLGRTVAPQLHVHRSVPPVCRNRTRKCGLGWPKCPLSPQLTLTSTLPYSLLPFAPISHFLPVFATSYPIFMVCQEKSVDNAAARRRLRLASTRTGGPSFPSSSCGVETPNA